MVVTKESVANAMTTIILAIALYYGPYCNFPLACMVTVILGKCRVAEVIMHH